MAKIFSEDAYCLGLLYAYLYSNRKMVLLEDLKSFHSAIERNLEDTKVNDMYATVWHDDEPSIYFASEGKNGEIYYVLNPRFDLERSKSKYIGCLSVEVLVASQKENALRAIDLKHEGKKIVKRNPNELIIPNMDFMKDVKVSTITYSEEYKKLQEEANARIEEGRRREAKAWHDAKNFIALSKNEDDKEKVRTRK